MGYIPEIILLSVQSTEPDFSQESSTPQYLEQCLRLALAVNLCCVLF